MFSQAQQGEIPRRSFKILALAALLSAIGLAVYAAVVPTGDVLPVGSKVSPKSLVVYSAASLPPEAKALEAATAPLAFDRDVLTAHVAYDVSQTEATLDAVQTVRAIKVYGPAPYLLTVQAESAGAYQAIPGLENLNLTKLAVAWNSFAATAPVTTGKLMFVLTPASGSTANGLQELEIWTTSAPVNVKSGAALLNKLLNNTAPPQGRLYNALNSTANPTLGVIGGTTDDLADNTFTFTIERDPAHVVRAWLTYELTGAPHWMMTRRAINGNAAQGGSLWGTSDTTALQVEKISPAWLKAGANAIVFSLPSGVTGSYSVRNVRVVTELDTGANIIEALIPNQPDATGANPVDAILDGDLATGWKPYPAGQPVSAAAPSVEFQFARATQMDAVSFYLSAPIEGQLQVSAQIYNPLTKTFVWTDLPPELGSVVTTGWNTIYAPATIPLALRIVNAVRLTFQGGYVSDAQVREFAFIGSGVGPRFYPPRAQVSFPDAGQFYGRTAYIRGYVAPHAEGTNLAAITVGGVAVTHADGAFGVLIAKDNVKVGTSYPFATQGDNEAWWVEVKATYKSGLSASTIVDLNNQITPAAPLAGAVAGSTSATVLAKGTKTFTIAHDESKLAFLAGAVGADTAITITPLRDLELPALDPGMVNVTKGPRRGYRFLPHGAKFLKNVTVTLPYDKSLVPPGHTEDDIRSYFFDESAGRWKVLACATVTAGKCSSVDKTGKRVDSLTNHFTDMINAVVTVPDHPEAVSFNPTSMKDIKAADPGAQVNLIEPPKANNLGDARLSYPIEVPPGRAGLQPQLAVSYNSSGGNGWMGMGWDLSMQSITIDTRWGVPRYSATQETETYSLNGEMLTPVAHRGALVARSAGSKQFYARVEGQFRKIMRHGTDPANYWWEVTDKNGVRSIYGGNLATNTPDPNAVLAKPAGTRPAGVFRWALKEVRDLNGNRMTYVYETVSDAGVADSAVNGRQLYLKQCFYTGNTAGTGAANTGRYSVTFVRDTAVAPDRRPDVQIDARGGFKQVTAHLLKRIDVKYDATLVRRYDFEYQEGAFKKTLLKSVKQFGTDGVTFAGQVNEHVFQYYDDIRNADNITYKGFDAAKSVGTGADNLKTRGFAHTVLGGTAGKSLGLDGFVGIGFGTKLVTVGVGLGASRAKSKGTNSFVDVDGDGLPDKVFLTDGGGFYRPNKTASGALDVVNFAAGANEKQPVNFSRPSESESTTSNLGVQAFVVGLTANGGIATTNTRDKSYLSDVNGDGLTDIVSGGTVLFSSARNTGTAGFSANSYDTDSPLGDVGGSVSQDILPDVSEERTRLEAENPLMDNVRRWVAPYDGTVRVSGGVRLVDVATDPRFTPEEKEERQGYKIADGVQVSIQKNGNAPLWNIPILATTYTEQLPTGVDAIPVTKGDRIFFRVQSVYDGAYDQVAWSPVVEYVSGGAALTAIDANVANAYRFKTGEDFVLAGRPLEMTVPYRGTLRLNGLLNKTAATTDDITLRVTVTDRTYAADGTVTSEIVKPPFNKLLARDFVGPVTLQEDFAVERYSGVKIDFVVDSPVDLTVLKWGEIGSSQAPRPGQPQWYYTVAYQEAESPVAPSDTQLDDANAGPTPTNADTLKNDAVNRKNTAGGMAPIPDEDGNPLTIPAKQLDTVDATTGKPLLTMPVKYDADIYAKNHLTAPQQAWIAPKDGTILWTPWVTLKPQPVPPATPYTLPNGSVVLTAKRHGVRLAKHEVLIQNSKVVEASNGYVGVQSFQVKAGDAIFFDASTRHTEIETQLGSAVAYMHYASTAAWQAPITDSIDILASIAGTPPAADPNSTAPVDGRAMFVAHRGNGEIVASEIIDFSTTPSVSLSYARPVTQSDLLYFDVFTITAGVSVQTQQVRTRYNSASNFIVPATGNVSLAPVLNFRAGAPNGDVTLTVLRNGANVAQQTYQIQNGAVVGAAVPLAVTAAETLSFAFSTANHVLSSYLSDKGAVVIDYLGAAPAGWTPQTIGSASFTITNLPIQFGYQAPQDTARHFPLNDPLFGNPYRGWAITAYNGNGTRAGLPINETLLAVTQSNINDYKDSTKQPNYWFALPEVEADRWQSLDDFWWTSATEVSASRQGLDNVYDPRDPREGGFADTRSSNFAGAARPPKMGKSKQKVMGFGFYLSVTRSQGDSTSQMDILDLNGDRFPDLVGQGGAAQYTWADGTFFDGGSAAGPARTGKDKQTTIGLSVGVPVAKSGARGVASQSGDTKPSETSSISVGASVNKGTNETRTDLIDVNGDGLPDRVAPAGGGLSVALNTGYGFESAETWTSGQLTRGTSLGKAGNVGFSMWNGLFGGGISLSENHNYTNTTLMDMNGDGLADVVSPGGTGRLSVLLNTGAGFIGPIDWPGALTPYKSLKNKTPGGPATVSDGTSSSASGSAKVGFGIGPFFGITISFSIGVNGGETVSQPSVAYNDVNGDGFVDGILTADDSEMKVVLNPIHRTNLLKKVSRPLGASFDLEYARSGNTYNHPQSRLVLSKTSVHDGVPGNGPDTQVTTFKYESGFYNRFERDFYGYQKITEAHHNTAANDALYRSLAREFLNDSFYTKGLLKTERTVDDANRLFIETENTYVLRDVHANSAPANPASTQATIFPQLTATHKRFFEPLKSPGQSKTTFTTHEYDVLGNVIRFVDAGEPGTTTDDVDATLGYTACAPAYLSKVNAITVKGNGVEQRKRTANINCTTGNLTQVSQHLGTQAAVTDLTYFANGNLQTVTGPLNKNNQRTALTYAYDPQVDTHVAKIVDSFNLSSTATHNYLFGKVETTTDTNTNQTTYFYDSVGRVEKIVGPYEQGQAQATLAFEYHPESPVPYAITRHADKDAAGQYKASASIDTILFTDGLKRVLQTKKDATVLEANASAPQDRMIVSGQVTFDAFGRTVTQRYPTTEPKAAGSVNGVYNTALDTEPPTVTDYDVLDRVTRTTLPDTSVTTLDYAFGPDRSGTLQFETLVKDANVNANKPGAIKATYRDARQLIVSVKEKLGATDLWTSYAYDPLKQIVEVKDDQGNLTQAVYDNLGRRTALNNPDTGNTGFTFDLAGNLTAQVTAVLRAASQSIQYDYDFTRPKSVTYPVNTGNNIAYTYGAPGAANNTAGRLIKTVSQMGSEERTYGKLGETTYEKKTVTTFTNPSSPSVFETKYAFDTFGRLQTLTYPDGEVLTNTYDSGGNLQSAEGAKGSFRYRYLNALHYDKFEQRVLMEQTNGVKTAYAYDPKTRRLNQLTAGKGQGAALFQNLSYGYDPVGNILSLKNLTDAPQGGDYGGPVFQQYQYDELYRLTKAQGVFQYNKTGITPDAAACAGSGNSHCRVYALDLTYDSIHNIKAKTQLDTRYPPGAPGIAQKKTSYNWTYAYNPAGPSSTRPHAPTHIGALTYQYDANGNQLGWTHDQNGTRRTIVWNEDNRIHTLSDNGAEKAYKYDDAGTRVIKRGPQGETVYVNQFYTQRPGATGSKHVYAGTSRIATKLLRQDVPGANPAGKTPYEKDIYFYHPDHLGSSSYVTDLNGKLYEHLQYFPFGEGWIEENSNVQRTPYLFTAKELDEETGLYYFGARYYDPRTSVWQSPDAILGQYLPSGRKDNSNLPGFGGVYNASNLNLYAYGHQNPVKYSDADGNVVFIPIIIGAIWVADKAYAAYEAHQDYKAIQSGEKTLAGVAKDRAAEHVAGAVAGTAGRLGVKAGKHVLKMADEVTSAGSSAAKKADDGVIYREGDPSPSNLKTREGEEALSFRDSLSNPIESKDRPVLRPDKKYFGIDTQKLPAGSVVRDNVPPGHVGVKGVDPQTLKDAVVERGKFPE